MRILRHFNRIYIIFITLLMFFRNINKEIEKKNEEKIEKSEFYQKYKFY